MNSQCFFRCRLFSFAHLIAEDLMLEITSHLLRVRLSRSMLFVHRRVHILQ